MARLDDPKTTMPDPRAADRTPFYIGVAIAAVIALSVFMMLDRNDVPTRATTDRPVATQPANPTTAPQTK